MVRTASALRLVAFVACGFLTVIALFAAAFGGGLLCLVLALIAFTGSCVAVARWGGYLIEYSDDAVTAAILTAAVSSGLGLGLVVVFGR
jgi:hypothetical protein